MEEFLNPMYTRFIPFLLFIDIFNSHRRGLVELLVQALVVMISLGFCFGYVNENVILA